MMQTFSLVISVVVFSTFTLIKTWKLQISTLNFIIQSISLVDYKISSFSKRYIFPTDVDLERSIASRTDSGFASEDCIFKLDLN